MDIDSKIRLQVILSKGIAEFTEHDIAFIKARASYLTDEQLEKVSHVFLSPPKPSEENKPEEVEEVKPNKFKKVKKY